MTNPCVRPELKIARKSIGTQAKVAKMLGISSNHLRYLENGINNPGRNLMLKMSKFFNIHHEILFADLYRKAKE